MSAYLFVHFRETTTPDGEQVYFGISRDGLHWEETNGGRPVLWCYYGDKGARDFTIAYCKYTKKYVIVGTDLSLSYGLRGKYHHSWAEISRHGSKAFSVWDSTDLLNWSEQRLVTVGDKNFGCMWAPDIIYDPEEEDYVMHWSSAHSGNGFGDKAIYYSRTRDFATFTQPQLLYRKEGAGSVIDSAIYREEGWYYLFLKSEKNPSGIQLLRSSSLTGTYEKIDAFDRSMRGIDPEKHEAPTAVKLDDGRWALFLDYFGVAGEKQGYIPFLSENLKSGVFERADAAFSFPYRFKHGTILKITEEQYEKIKRHNFVPEDNR
ncbi:MAG: glycoside hydrolase family 43 protein [Lachnospiraceae bacterium]|nr:glycoside hydrolase family 43 protein [Lachnospiraceae bacterium]